MNFRVHRTECMLFLSLLRSKLSRGIGRNLSADVPAARDRNEARGPGIGEAAFDESQAQGWVLAPINCDSYWELSIMCNLH